MTVPDFASGPVTLPDQRRVMRLGILLHCKDKWRVPAPAVDSGDAYATFEEVHRGLPSHAAAFRDVIRTSICHSRTCVHDDNLKWRKRVADALEFGFDIFPSRNVAIGKMPEVELHAGLEAPVERNFVDGDCALAVVHGRRKVPGRIEMRRAVRRKAHPLEAPAFAVRQVFLS